MRFLTYLLLFYLIMPGCRDFSRLSEIVSHRRPDRLPQRCHKPAAQTKCERNARFLKNDSLFFSFFNRLGRRKLQELNAERFQEKATLARIKLHCCASFDV